MLIVQGEDQYIKQYLEALSSRSVRYGKDYCSRQLPSSSRIKRKPNAPQESTATPISTESPKIDVVIKVLKPASQLTITGISVNDTIEDLKERIAKQYGNGLTLNRQRLLLKGKALSDPKCLSEYNLTDKTTLHLMITAAPASPAPASSPAMGRFGLSVTADEKIKDAAFWDAIKSTVAQQLGGVDKDVDIVLEKMKSNLSQ
ncbi:hypothetical protein K492DRAFT_140200 [Lichtheimia hyalospora FSU 10163]|nr:hypothetical protein K492DRAFT_140200 [Lichtheimia hyalospora FSU 10163]